MQCVCVCLLIVELAEVEPARCSVLCQLWWCLAAGGLAQLDGCFLAPTARVCGLGAATGTAACGMWSVAAAAAC